MDDTSKYLLGEGKRIFDIEIDALVKMKEALDDTYLEVLRLVSTCKGKVIVTGMGKPGHVAAKIAATLASLGTPAFHLHPAEAMHGDLGMISSNDVVIAISFSGESDEIIRILPNIKMIGATIVGITGNAESALAKASDIVQIFPSFDEACYLGLAPTSSTTVALCYGDAIAVVASGIYGFKDTDFGKLHPAGSLGRKLVLTVDDLMVKDEDIPKVDDRNMLTEAIAEMTQKGIGVVSIVDDNNKLVGILTDGDLRRIIEKRIDIYSESISNVMTRNPKRITKDRLAVDALQYLRKNKINNIPVVDNNDCLIGTITLQHIVHAGIVL